jgi:hypothetical protein
MAIDLLDHRGNAINVNDKLVTLCYADRAEEDFTSKVKHAKYWASI